MSISPKLLKYITPGSDLQVATVSAGCFWGVENIYRKHFLNKGLISTAVGYTGGSTVSPTYKQVCTSSTGHAEALQILFDPSKVSYSTLIDFFFRIHDPTTLDYQGPDRGPQYRSAIFTHSTEQQKQAEETKDKFQKKFWTTPIVTTISTAPTWYDAEEYHQGYLDKNVGGYECPTHYVRHIRGN